MKKLLLPLLCLLLTSGSTSADINITNIVLASGLSTSDSLLGVTNHTHTARATVQQVIDLAAQQITPGTNTLNQTTNLNYYWTTNVTIQVVTNLINNTTNLNYYWTTNVTFQVITNTLNSTTNLNYYWTTNTTLQIVTNILNSTTNLNYYWTTNVTFEVITNTINNTTNLNNYWTTNVTINYISNYFNTNIPASLIPVSGTTNYVFSDTGAVSFTCSVIASLPTNGMYRFVMCATETGSVDFDPGGNSELFNLTYSDRLVDSPVTTADVPMTIVRSGPPAYGRLDFTQVFQGKVGTAVSFNWHHTGYATVTDPVTNIIMYSLERLH